MNQIKVFWNGLVKENPTFVLLLGMCPTLGTTSSALNGMSMGLATMAVLIFSNLIISLIKNFIPDMVRIPSYIVVIASLVTILQMVIKAYAPEIDQSLGLFIPLIVVNCIILGRAEAFAAKNDPLSSVTGRARVARHGPHLLPRCFPRGLWCFGLCAGSRCFHCFGLSHRHRQSS